MPGRIVRVVTIIYSRHGDYAISVIPLQRPYITAQLVECSEHRVLYPEHDLTRVELHERQWHIHAARARA